MELLPHVTNVGINGKAQRLDLKDRRILAFLSENARTPVSKIAKFVRLSRDAVRYRLDGYSASGLLHGTVAMLDAGKLGFTSYHLFLRLKGQGKSGSSEKEMMEKLRALPNVRTIIRFFGAYDLEIALIARSFKEFESSLAKINGIIGESLRVCEEVLLADQLVARPFPKSFFGALPKKDTIEIMNSKKYAPDSKDFLILRQIREDTRMPAIEISEKTGLSLDVVRYRLKNMEDSLVSFRPAINFRQLGYNIHVLLLDFLIDRVSEARLPEFFINDENVLWATRAFGRFNIIAYICTEDNSKLQETIGRIRAAFPESVLGYELLLVSEQYKYTYIPDCVFEGM